MHFLALLMKSSSNLVLDQICLEEQLASKSVRLVSKLGIGSDMGMVGDRTSWVGAMLSYVVV